ncbi:Cortactin-binding protein 2 [Porphyridium purpureum]|uniref:Cortactin-binding protein 2 n=1 Tax=Porphyridium purpureum TaxID=35688 RepID=A0A5J4YPX5_PORPP|nr:Cortactin-binding protein 2 [Porphyridium purpureum]|eukprot:POR9128..scf295_9
MYSSGVRRLRAAGEHAAGVDDAGGGGATMAPGKRKTGGVRRQLMRRQAAYAVRSEQSAEREQMSAGVAQEMFEHIEASRNALFGLVRLSRLDVNQVCQYKSASKPCTSLAECNENFREKTLLQFAAELKRYRIMYALIRSGADPSVCPEIPQGLDNVREYVQSLHSAVAVWITLVVCNGSTAAIHSERDARCQICSCSILPIQLIPCLHVVCSACFWKHAVTRSVFEHVTCPIPACGSNLRLDGEDREENEQVSLNASSEESTAQQSKQKWLSLPPELPAKSPKNKSWIRPMSPAARARWLPFSSSALCRSGRNQLLWLAAEQGNRLLLVSLIEAGVDIDAVNDAGQTALFIASWRGRVECVKVLLDSGADASIADPVGILPIDFESSDWSGRNWLMNAGTPEEDLTQKQFMEWLVDPSINHASAGSFVLDGFVPESVLTKIDLILSRLPVVAPCKSESLHNERAFYCDASGFVSAALVRAIRQAAAFLGMELPVTGVFAQMRFLIYEHAGGGLPAHNDLAKTDPVTKQRSGFTFVLYLSDISKGGETVLLSSVSSSPEVMAMIKPKRGRLLCFPHASPHEARPVIDTPKILLRGEMFA